MTPEQSAGQNFNGLNITLLAGQARKASDILKALSHETRLLILWLLSENEKTVSELEHFLVSTRREGRIIHYSITDPGISAVVTSLYKLLCDADEQDS